MTRFFRSRFTLVTALLLWVCMVPSKADGLHWRYVALDQAALPAPYVSFFPSDISDNGSVVGTLCNSDCSVSGVGVYMEGNVTALSGLPAGSMAGPVNERGTIGGFVVVDPVNFIAHAALFRKDKVVLIPPQPGEQFSSVFCLNDEDTAIVVSFGSAGITNVLYSDGQAAPINFPSNIVNPILLLGGSKCINDDGILEGISQNHGRFTDARGFRLDLRSGKAMLLNPFPGDPTETLAWAQEINEDGDVLGYSFVSKAPYHERIGLWDNKGTFHTYFVETVSSNLLLFNDDKLIVITGFSQSSPGRELHRTQARCSPELSRSRRQSSCRPRLSSDYWVE